VELRDETGTFSIAESAAIADGDFEDIDDLGI